MSASTSPLVSVGMPAYNSERTIAEAMDCVLGQDLTDLELIVSDNGSMDGTWDVIQAYARRDPRVVAIRQPVNVGANGNYSAVARAARGRYFKWASSNDWCGTQFVSRCVAYLEAHPDVVLVSPRTRLFHDTIDQGQDYDGDLAFEQDDPVVRLKDITSRLRLNNVMNGLLRLDVLRRTRLIEHFRGADIVLVAHIAMLGKIALLDEHLFGRRMEPTTATALMDRAAVDRHHHPVRTTRALFPNWRRTLGHLQSVFATDLPPAAKRRALVWMLRLSFWNSPNLRRDLTDAVRFSIHR